jgi:hypothetical protein
MFKVYKGLAKRHWLSQWHLLHTHVWWNKLRRRYDAVEVIRLDAKWSYSKFPNPLVTLDYDAEDNLIAISVIGKGLKVCTS